MTDFSTGTRGTARQFLPMVVLLFFVWGFATVLNDTLIPKLKSVFSLSYTEVMLTQFCFFAAYFVISVPAGMLLARIGYVRGIVVGLVIMATGCLMFTPAAALGVYGGFLVALFVLASGITMLQVVANPLIARLGKPETSESRLTLAQAFNSVGTTIGPFVGSALLLANGLTSPPGDAASLPPAVLDGYRRAEMHATQLPYAVFGGILLVLAVAFWRLKQQAGTPFATQIAQAGTAANPLTRPRLALGVVSIFVYVGAEVSIGSALVIYLMSERILGIGAADAGKLVSLYWGGAMIGRFVGSWVLTRIQGGTALCVCALGAAILATIAAASSGMAAAVAVLSIGLCNSIMFPTIFTLAIENLGPDTPRGSGLLNLAIVGGAIVPLIAGAVADRAGIGVALLVPAACHVWIAVYGILTRTGLVDRPVV